MMKSPMTQIAIIGLMILALATPVLAKGPSAVRNTIHNLSMTAPESPTMPGFTPYLSNEDEVCIFCHTPHGGSLTGPLWNHTVTAETFTHYNSATLSSQIGADSRPPGDESLLCLSCHDGTISVYSMYNTSNDIGDPYNVNAGYPAGLNTPIVDLFGTGGPLIGTDLTNDHPISFSYNSVLNNFPYATGDPKNGQLRDTAVATGSGVRFFGATQRVECSSCHDPHVDYVSAGNTAFAPFLVTTNTGSKLCLACHNK